MTLLGRDQILAADDRQVEDVECPEWGGTVRIRSLTGAERDAYEASLIKGRGRKQQLDLANVRAKLVVASAVDEHGQPLFTRADVLALAGKSAAPLARLFEAAQRLSGLSDEDIEELTEDFGDAPS